jgi:hypothetical protein
MAAAKRICLWALQTESTLMILMLRSALARTMFISIFPDALNNASHVDRWRHPSTDRMRRICS